MFKKIGAITILILGGVLLVYSATRSLDFISLTLPDDRKALAYFGLAALDGGLVAWILSYLYGSKGWQRAIAFLMVLVDLVGAIAMFTLDTLYNTGKAGMTTALTPSEMQTAVLALSGVIGLNIAAAVAHHLTDPEKLREQAEEDAFSKVEDATLKQISQNADTLAAQLAPTLAADWMQNTRARYMANVGTGKITTLIDVPSENLSSFPVMPVFAQPKETKPFNLSALWAGLFKAKNNGRTYQSVSPVVTETKAGSLYEAVKQGIGDAQGVTSDKLHSPVDGMARMFSEEPSYHPMNKMQPITNPKTEDTSFTEAPKS